MKTKKAKALWIIITVVLIAAALFYVYQNKTSPDDNWVGGVNLAPATDEDKRDNDRRKSEITEQDTVQDEQARPSTDKKTVTPIISAWGQPAGPQTDLKINGYVGTIIESDGTCTVELIKDSNKVSVSKKALQNATNTSCGQLTIPYTEISAGSWRTTLTYSSPHSEGKSETVIIEVL